MDSIEKLTEIFSHFPGIGPRQAKRFVYHLLNQSDSSREQLVELIISLKKEASSCNFCKKFFYSGGQSGLCKICRDPGRNKEKLMIVAKDIDMENIERSGSYDGLYFIIGGLLPILEKKPESKIRQVELLETLGKISGLKEVILALSATTEGDHTADYLKDLLSPLSAEKGFRVSKLGRGLSTGTELEYSDADTIKNALKNRE